ncbi:iron-sulfur cluster assembly protein, putative [Trypanosoma equiperdum]|uniref:Iron-sulfur cluster assembly protein n=2 Tax=Trypanozoon TaxID=39700 RepID=Q389E2_TRYB2|nr:hypothetical protein, conserved [Trypanosoma brucei brucei TREU927]EAN78578.1 hypothetical protein, conserved [Trypanosoma brucei brucei TREU927]SCU69814.1 iron-sulfur cluster assembly protein, putative [Trypanosoma equiperdum]
MTNTVKHSMARLRAKMLGAAKMFPDYNFRHYFVQHVKDQFVAMEKWGVEEQRRFLRQEGAKKLSEMRRMALVNRMYSSQPVFLDERAASKPSVTQEEEE